jgi:hypothetical protein
MPPVDPNCMSPWIEFFKTLPSIVTMLTAIIAAYVGLKSLSRWREESVGKRKSELAEHVLADFYQVRDIFEWVRFPGSYADEGAERPRIEGEREDEARRRDSYYVPIARLTKEAEFFGAFQARKYRFVALFGTHAGTPFQELKDIQSKIVVASRMLARGDYDSDLQRELEATIGWIGRDDEIKRRVENAVALIEEICRPVLKT